MLLYSLLPVLILLLQQFNNNNDNNINYDNIIIIIINNNFFIYNLLNTLLDYCSKLTCPEGSQVYRA